MSLINREALLSFEKMDADLCATCGEHHTAEDVIMMIKTAPTVDAAPVIRCRECRKWQKQDTTWLCRGFGYCTECMMGCHADNYCSYGYRKEGAD